MREQRGSLLGRGTMADGSGGSSLPFGLQPQTIKPGAVRSMTSEKLATFSMGATKKTPFQLHKEKMEAKRKAEEEAASKLLSEWTEEFEGDGGKPKEFVRGGVMGSDRGDERGRSSGPPRSLAKPQQRQSMKSMFNPDEDIDGEDIDGEALPPTHGGGAPKPPGFNRIAAPVLRKKETAPPAAPPVKKKDAKPSQMASFMEELRREQEEREIRGEVACTAARTPPRAG